MTNLHRFRQILRRNIQHQRWMRSHGWPTPQTELVALRHAFTMRNIP